MVGFTEEETLIICNKTSKGIPLQEAKKQVMSSREIVDSVANDTQEKKKTAAEKKKELAQKIMALGGEVPAEGASVAKYQEALAAAELL